MKSCKNGVQKNFSSPELLHLVSLLFSHSLTLLIVKAEYEESIKYFDEFEYCLIVITWCVSSNWPEKCPMSLCRPRRDSVVRIVTTHCQENYHENCGGVTMRNTNCRSECLKSPNIVKFNRQPKQWFGNSF